MLMMIDCEIIGCIPEKLMMLVCPLFVVNDTFFSIARCNVSKPHNVKITVTPIIPQPACTQSGQIRTVFFIELWLYLNLIHLC